MVNNGCFQCHGGRSAGAHPAYCNNYNLSTNILNRMHLMYQNCNYLLRKRFDVFRFDEKPEKKEKGRPFRDGPSNSVIDRLPAGISLHPTW